MYFRLIWNILDGHELVVRALIIIGGRCILETKRCEWMNKFLNAHFLWQRKKPVSVKLVTWCLYSWFHFLSLFLQTVSTFWCQWRNIYSWMRGCSRLYNRQNWSVNLFSQWGRLPFHCRWIWQNWQVLVHVFRVVLLCLIDDVQLYLLWTATCLGKHLPFTDKCCWQFFCNVFFTCFLGSELSFPVIFSSVKFGGRSKQVLLHTVLNLSL